MSDNSIKIARMVYEQYKDLKKLRQGGIFDQDPNAKKDLKAMKRVIRYNTTPGERLMLGIKIR